MPHWIVTSYRFIADNATRWLGFLSGTIAAVASVGGIIPEAHMKYYMGTIAVLTFWRGHFTAKKFEAVKNAGASP